MIFIKIIDTNKSIYELIQKYPEFKKVLYDIGFKDITKPVMLQTVGKIMTLKKGAMMKNIDFEDIKVKLKTLGYEVKE